MTKMMIDVMKVTDDVDEHHKNIMNKRKTTNLPPFVWPFKSNNTCIMDERHSLTS